MRCIALLWLLLLAIASADDANTAGGVTITEIFSSGQDGATAAMTFHPVIYPGADDISAMTQSDYGKHTTTPPAYEYGPSDFFDCESYSKSRSSSAPSVALSGTAPSYKNSSTAPNATIAAPIQRTGPITIAPHATGVPFEDYWCSSYASTVQDSALESFQNNGTISPFFYGLAPSAKTECMSIEAEDYSKWITNGHPLSSTAPVAAFRPAGQLMWTPTLTPPCCNTYCNLVVPSAQLVYWPTPAPLAMKNKTTLVGPDGFTYTSPSVYIVYRGISATDDCGQTLGSTTTSLTLSFAPKDVTTFSNHQEGGYTYKTIDYATLWSNCSERYTYSSVSGPPCAKTITTEEASCDTQISTIGKEALFWREHCYPQLSFPPTARLQGINTAWKQCDMGNVDTSIIGVFDPPRALRPGTAMVAPAPTQTPSLPDPAIAAPASQILPPQPEKTSSPNDPKASSDAPGKQGPGSVPQAAQPNYGGSPEPASGGATPATMTKSVDPKPGVDSQSNLPAPLYPPTINESPSDPNNESPGMMSALHQALGSDPAPSPQNQPAAAPNGVSQPETGNDENAPVPAPNQLVSDRPAPDQVGTDQSVTNKPPVNRPVISQPSPDQPVANQPTVNQDSVHQPGSNQPANPPQEVGSKENSPATGDIYSPEGSLSNAGASKDTAKGNSQTNPYSGSSYVPEIGPIDDNPEAGVSAHGQNSDSSLDGISNNGGLPPNPAPVIQGSQPGNPALAALPPPQFTVPVENGKTLLGAIINLSSVILAGSSGGATIQAGASPTQVLGHTVSVDPAASKIVINGQEHGLPTQDLSGPNYHDSSNNYDGVITPGSGPDIPVSGASQNQPVAQPNFPALQQNNGGQAPSAVVAGAPAVPLTTIIGNHVVAAISSAPNAILIDGQTISHGSNPITIANTPVAYQANGDLVFGTFTISNIIPAIAPPLPSPPFTTSIANHAIAAIPSSPNAILVDGQIISHGAASVTLFGTPVAYKPNGDLVLGSTTFTSVTPPAVFASTSPTAPAVFTINGQAATILPNNAGVEIAGTTLLANAPPISISGAVSASYGSAGLVVGTSTVKPPQSLFAALKSPDALTSITLAGQVFTYAVSQTAITSSGSSGVILGTSAVAYTSTAPDGAAIIGSSSILYTSSLPALPSATQNVGNLIQSGLNRSGLGNKGSGTVNIAQGSATGVITTGVNTHRPASGMGSVSKRVHVLVGTLAAIVGFSWGCT